MWAGFHLARILVTATPFQLRVWQVLLGRLIAVIPNMRGSHSHRHGGRQGTGSQLDEKKETIIEKGRSEGLSLTLRQCDDVMIRLDIWGKRTTHIDIQGYLNVLDVQGYLNHICNYRSLLAQLCVTVSGYLHSPFHSISTLHSTFCTSISFLLIPVLFDSPMD